MVPVLYPLIGFLLPTMTSDPESKPHLYYTLEESPFSFRRISMQVFRFSLIRRMFIPLVIFLIWIGILVFCITNQASDPLFHFGDSQLQLYWFKSDRQGIGTFVSTCITYFLCVLFYYIMGACLPDDERTQFYRHIFLLSYKSSSYNENDSNKLPGINFMSVVDANDIFLKSNYLWTRKSYLYFKRIISLARYDYWFAIVKGSWVFPDHCPRFLKVFLALFISPLIFVFNIVSFILQCTMNTGHGKMFVFFKKFHGLYSTIIDARNNTRRLSLGVLMIVSLLSDVFFLLITYETVIIFVVSPMITLFQIVIFTSIGLAKNLGFYAPYLLPAAIAIREIHHACKYFTNLYKDILDKIFECITEDLPMVTCEYTMLEPIRLPVSIFDKIRKAVYPISECLADVFLQLLPVSIFYTLAFIHIFNSSNDVAFGMSPNVLEYIFVWVFPTYMREIFKADVYKTTFLKIKIKKYIVQYQSSLIHVVSETGSQGDPNERSPLLQ